MCAPSSLLPACFAADNGEDGCSLECLQSVCEVQQLATSGKCQDVQATMQLMGAAFRQLDASCMAVGSTGMVPAKFKCAAVSALPAAG